MPRLLVGTLTVVCGLAAAAARADDLPPKYRDAVNKGLTYLSKAQLNDGHWEANGGAYPTTMTALSGMAFLMEGSTIRDGKYADKIPKAIVNNAHDYLKKCTTARGGVIYSLANGNAFNGAERPTLTAAAVACLFNAGEYNSEYARKWLKYCQTSIPIDKTGRDSFGHW